VQTSDRIKMPLPIVLIDMDEVLFPWAHAYRNFRNRRGLSAIPEAAWNSYTIGEATIPGHQDIMADFHSDPEVIATPPIPGRAEDCKTLAKHFTLIACTSRYEATEGPGTLKWVERWAADWLTGVRFCNWHPETRLPSSKPRVAEETSAVALIDDHPKHLEGLVGGVHGFLVARPAGLASAPGARPWSAVFKELQALSENNGG